MALINCIDCGREVSDRATACVHCGCPLSYSVYNVSINGRVKHSCDDNVESVSEDFTEKHINELISITDEMDCSEVKRRAEIIRDTIGFTSVATRFKKQYGKAHIVGKRSDYCLMPIISRDGKFAMNVGKTEYCNWIPDNDRVNIYGESVIGHEEKPFCGNRTT